MGRNFLSDYILAKKKRYQALTHRYGYRIVKGMRKSDF